jgi:pimeloyl-ACP methyl ester carboxylesterase
MEETMSTAFEVQERSRTSTGENYREQLMDGLPLGDLRLTLSGVPTAVLEGGGGPPVVLLHGPGEFAATWMRIIPYLAKDHHVVAPDLPGHGATGLPGEPLNVDFMNGWLGELIERTCAEPPVLIGHLLGGAIAARYALARPDQVRRLVLVDAMGLGPFRPNLRFALAMAGFIARPNERTQERLFRGCFHDLDDVRRQMGKQWAPMTSYALERARTPELQAALRKLMPKFALNTIPHAELARLRVPTTLIWGRHDLQVRLSIAEEASARYGWPLHIIEGAADDPAVEQPEAFLAAFRKALSTT